MTGWFDKAGLAALGAAALLVATPAVQAQEMSLGALVDRLDRIERALGSVQRRLAREGVPAAAEAGTAAAAPEAAARQEIRLGEIEEQVRLLTGQVEEARFQVRRLGERLDTLADIEGRLAAIETRLGAAPPAVAGAEPGAVVAAAPGAGEGASTVIDSGGAVLVGRDPNVERYETMGVLGTVPAEGEETPPAATGDAEPTLAAVAPVAPPPAPVDPQTQYQSAIRLLSQTDYAAAEATFQAIIDNHAEHPLAGNAHFWIGEIHMKRQDYQRAAISFARGYKAFPTGNKAADSLLKLGMAFAAMDKTQEACATLDKLKRDHVDAPAHVRDRLPGEWSRAGCG